MARETPRAWGLLVDTEYLHCEVKDRFGRRSRFDYLRLPENVVKKVSEIHYFAEKVAVVMRRDAVWETFADSLKRFGYVVIPTDCGLHSRAVMIQARDLLGRGVGLIVLSSLVTAERLLSELEEVAEIKVFTFESGQRRLEFDGCDGVQFLEIDPAWLWKKDEGD